MAPVLPPRLRIRTPRCDCGLPLIGTAEIGASSPRRLWRCAALHEVWRDDTAALPVVDPPPAPAGQMGLL